MVALLVLCQSCGKSQIASSSNRDKSLVARAYLHPRHPWVIYWGEITIRDQENIGADITFYDGKDVASQVRRNLTGLKWNGDTLRIPGGPKWVDREIVIILGRDSL